MNISLLLKVYGETIAIPLKSIVLCSFPMYVSEAQGGMLPAVLNFKAGFTL
jgi:hypothetical protein